MIDLQSHLMAIPLPDWLPGETLFSHTSRTHALWGYRDAGQTAAILFGTRRAGTQHDLPSCLDEWEARTASILGSAGTVARQRTLLTYYRKFMSAEDENEVVAQIRGPSVAHLKFRLGLLTSRFRACHPLKACVECVQEDVERHGWAFWHLEHQYPGVWACRKHGCGLRESLRKSTGVGRFAWHLPDIGDLRAEASFDAERVGALASTIVELVENEWLERIDSATLHATYRNELARRGWITGQGRLRLQVIAQEFLEHSRALRSLPELRALPDSYDAAVVQVGRLLRPARTGTHPIRHFVTVNWLFGGARLFLNAYRASQHEPDGALGKEPPSVNFSSIKTGDPRRAEFFALLRDDPSLSMRGAAAALGMDTSTAMAWAARAGVRVNRRAKFLTLDKRMRLVATLRSGCEKRDAAQEIGVSIQTVTRTLLTEIGLHDAWCQARLARTRSAHRQTWTWLLAECGFLGAKVMRSMAPTAYAWLYRNDRAWLQANRPNVATRNTQHRPLVRWEERDVTLSTQVQQAALALSRQQGIHRIFLWQLYQAVPDLKPKLQVLDRLPLTRKVIVMVLAWRRDQPFSEDLLG